MSEKKIAQMEQILALKFQQRQQIFSKVRAEENRLRAQMVKLVAQEQEAETINDDRIKAIGADVIWKAWVGRAKTTLNMELAQVLAQKERLLVSVRRDYGKLLVSQKLLRDQKMAAVEARRKVSLNTSINSHFNQQPAKLPK